jgi:hypothetical protein
MKSPAKILFAAIPLTLCLVGPVSAQTEAKQPSSHNATQEIKTGASRVGEGAVHVGHGIEQGAILTWHALKKSAASVAARFNGG